jgi:hypothetical protein
VTAPDGFVTEARRPPSSYAFVVVWPPAPVTLGRSWNEGATRMNGFPDCTLRSPRSNRRRHPLRLRGDHACDLEQVPASKPESGSGGTQQWATSVQGRGFRSPGRPRGRPGQCSGSTPTARSSTPSWSTPASLCSRTTSSKNERALPAPRDQPNTVFDPQTIAATHSDVAPNVLPTIHTRWDGFFGGYEVEWRKAAGTAWLPLGRDCQNRRARTRQTLHTLVNLASVVGEAAKLGTG